MAFGLLILQKNITATQADNNQSKNYSSSQCYYVGCIQKVHRLSCFQQEITLAETRLWSAGTPSGFARPIPGTDD